MKPSLVIKRFTIFYVGAFCVLFAVGLLKGRPWQSAALESAIWGGISATIFVVAVLVRARRNQYCALCGELPPGTVADQAKPGPR